MLTIDEFPHHDAHRYVNDDRQAAIVLFLLGVFWIVAGRLRLV